MKTTVNCIQSYCDRVSWGLICSGELKRLLLVQLDTKKIPKKGGRGEGKKDKERRGEVVRGRRKTNNPCQLHWRNCVDFLLLVWQTSWMLIANQAQLYGPSNSEFKFRFSQLWKSLVQCHANLKACMASRKWPSNISSQCAKKRLEIKSVPIKKNSKTYRLIWSWKRAESSTCNAKVHFLSKPRVFHLK